MNEKTSTPSRSHEPAGRAASIAVSCGMEDCDHSAHLRFVGEPPFEAFRFDTEGWTVVEDTEDGRTVFLCTNCAREFEAEVAGGEDAELDADDEELEEEDEPDSA